MSLSENKVINSTYKLPELTPTQVVLLFKEGKLVRVLTDANVLGGGCDCCRACGCDIGPDKDYDAYEIVDLATTPYVSPKHWRGSRQYPVSVPKLHVNTEGLLSHLGTRDVDLQKYLASLPVGEVIAVCKHDNDTLLVATSPDSKDVLAYKAENKFALHVWFALEKEATERWALFIPAPQSDLGNTTTKESKKCHN